MGGGFALLIMNMWQAGWKLNEDTVPIICNGMLAGLVAITGSCDTMQPWAAIVFSMLGGIVYFTLSYLLKKA
jgi:Amt family ammonium transporter